jgi:uncharacterized protein YndB with AHSA1/START domain
MARKGARLVTEQTQTAKTFSKPSDRELAMTRHFDAPRELVFAAMTDAKHIPHWWGPRGIETIVDTLDLRPGGRWRFIHRGPDGVEYGFNGEFREIVPPERLVYTFEFEGMPGHVAVETVTFEDLDGRTKVTSVSLFPSVEDRDGMLESGAEQGAVETWDRLAELLERLQS